MRSMSSPPSAVCRGVASNKPTDPTCMWTAWSSRSRKLASRAVNRSECEYVMAVPPLGEDRPSTVPSRGRWWVRARAHRDSHAAEMPGALVAPRVGSRRATAERVQHGADQEHDVHGHAVGNAVGTFPRLHPLKGDVHADDQLVDQHRTRAVAVAGTDRRRDFLQVDGGHLGAEIVAEL